MKKSLLFSAAALLLSGTMTAQTFNVETVWSYDVTDGTAHNVPGLDAGWGGLQNNPATVSATCSRFGVGRNGKILTTDHKLNAIVAIDATGVTTFKELPARTAEKWNGTVVTTDDAGNVIINYCFIDATKSAQEWGVITKDGNLYDLTCASSLANQGATGRVDIMGHVVGDVTSAEGGIGYVVSQSAGAVIKMTFKGDGTKPTELNCVKAYDYPLPAVTAMGGNSQLASACPRFTSVEAINAFDGPAFIIPLGICGNQVENCPSIEDGWVGKFVPNWSPAAPAMGNRWYMGIAYFELGGKSYVVRNYVSPEFEAAHLSGGEPFFTKWCATMNFAVYEYDAAAGTATIAATWQESTYSNGNGMGTLTAEVVDENTVNIYTYASTGSADARTGTVAGVYCAMVKLTLGGESDAMVGDGTEANPYQVTKPAHIEAMKDLVSATTPTYFKLMNDIDMTGINHVPTVGSANADFGKTIHFDGNNHVISNLRSVAENEEFYYASLFGVFTGSVKNLGLVDVELKSQLGVAGLGGYVGYGTASTVDNCYVTGKVESLTAYAAGLMGTNSADVTISNSYAQVDVKGAGFAGGLVGRGRNTITLNNCYVSGTVGAVAEKTPVMALVGATDKADGSAKLVCNNVVAVNTGATDNFGNYGTAASGSVSTDIADVALWTAYNEGKLFNDFPALNWQENADKAIEGEGTEANPYQISTAAELAKMWTLMKEGEVTYFVQTADINASQITDYTAPNGYNGQYARAINYDGQNHIISNFAPATREATNVNNGYYCTTVFGVMQGTVKNLGIVDAACINPTLEGGILGGFGGGAWVAGVTSKVDNVFVTGVVEGSTCGYGVMNGGFFGCAAGTIEITNSYAQVNLNAENVADDLKAGAKVGGFYAAAGDNNVTLANCYFAGEVKGATANLVAAAGTVKATNVYAFGTGTAVEGATVVPANDATAIAAIKGWAAFNEGKLYNGLPALNWQDVDASSIDEVVAEENADAPVEYYNLQGIRVENPSNGLYIRKQGSKATKVLVR